MKIKSCCEWMKISLEKGIVCVKKNDIFHKVQAIGGDQEFFIFHCPSCGYSIEFEEDKTERLKEDINKLNDIHFDEDLIKVNIFVNRLADRIDKLESNQKETETQETK